MPCYRLHLREEDPVILQTILRAMQDPEPLVRAAAARAVGDLRKPESVEPLLNQLEVESDPHMQAEILTTLELMCLDESEINLLPDVIGAGRVFLGTAGAYAAHNPDRLPAQEDSRVARGDRRQPVS
jgi:hypothetical protein